MRSEVLDHRPAVAAPSSAWQRALASAIRDPDHLIDLLQLPEEYRAAARRAARLFPVMAPLSYVGRMRRGDPADPLLLQVLPLGGEEAEVPGFVADAVGDGTARRAPGLLQKYAGRVLLVTTGACAVHCRYCFRRQYPYHAEPHRLDDWEPAFQTIEADLSVHEVILSGGDPLMLTDARLTAFWKRIREIPHVTRIRIHTRLPIVLPERVTPALLDILTQDGPACVIVVHANHPHELEGDCGEALRRLVRGGLPVLNQSVLLKGINNSAETLAALCEGLVNLGVMPYYLHQLDRVHGTAHFEVPEDEGQKILAALRRRLPGYAVPRYVREVAAEDHKTPLE